MRGFTVVNPSLSNQCGLSVSSVASSSWSMSAVCLDLSTTKRRQSTIDVCGNSANPQYICIWVCVCFITDLMQCNNGFFSSRYTYVHNYVAMHFLLLCICTFLMNSSKIRVILLHFCQQIIIFGCVEILECFLLYNHIFYFTYTRFWCANIHIINILCHLSADILEWARTVVMVVTLRNSLPTHVHDSKHNMSRVTTAEVNTAAQLLWWLWWGKILKPSIVFLVFLFVLKSLFLCHCGQDDTSQNSLCVRFDLSVSGVCFWNWKHGVQLPFTCTAGHHFQWQMEWHGCILMLKQLTVTKSNSKYSLTIRCRAVHNTYKFHIYVVEIALWIHLLAMRLSLKIWTRRKYC